MGSSLLSATRAFPSSAAPPALQPPRVLHGEPLFLPSPVVTLALAPRDRAALEIASESLLEDEMDRDEE